MCYRCHKSHYIYINCSQFLPSNYANWHAMSSDPCLSQCRLPLTHAKVHFPPPHKGMSLARLTLRDVISRCLFTSWKLFYWMHNKTSFGSNQDMTQFIPRQQSRPVWDDYTSHCQRFPFDLLYKCFVFHLEDLSFSLWINTTNCIATIYWVILLVAVCYTSDYKNTKISVDKVTSGIL